jgi:serine/threonine-protein kinase
MTGTRWEKINEIFEAAVKLAPAERDIYIKKACTGEGSLRAEIETLLAAHSRAKDFMESPAAGEVADEILGVRHDPKSGQVIGHYRIVAEIGKGGQGAVYKAVDTRLDRTVALKTLPAGFLTDETTLKRFQREARLASSLDHPNICTVHDLTEIDGAHFIVMQFVEGKNIRQLVKGSPLEIKSALMIAVQVCDALAAAHGKGIIHRDIKAHNVIVTADGNVKVLDFGLARTTGENSPDQTELTVPGSPYGTPTYAAPEQSRGEKVDHRADIFSTGVLLYEMLTGTWAFHGKTAIDVRHSVLYDEPAPVAERRGEEISAKLQGIVDKALAKGPADRYQNISAMRDELVGALRELPAGETSETERFINSFKPRHLRPWGGFAKALTAIVAVILLVLGAAGVYRSFSSPAKQKPIESVAVLPFTNETADPNAEYLSDGISESLINDLSQLPSLKVSPRNTVFRYKDKQAEAQSVGKELGVGAVLTGSLRQIGDRISISVELVDVSENRQLWGQQYVRKFADVFDMQRDITREVAAQLRLKLTGEQQQSIAKQQTADPEAYRLYLQGRYLAVKMTKESLEKGIKYLEQAIELDPNYALAYSGLAFYYVQSLDQIMPPSEAMPKSRQAALKAIELDDTLAEAHVSLAFVYWQYDWNWEKAAQEYRRAMELAPDNGENRAAYGFFLILMGRSEEGIAEINEASRLNPLSIETGLYVSPGYYFARRYDISLQKSREALETTPDFWLLHLIVGRALEQKGDLKGAMEEYQKAREIDQNTSEILMDLGRAYGASGKRAEAEKILMTLKQRETTGYVSPFQTAMVHIGLNDKTKALDALEEAYEARSWYMSWLKTAPELDPLRSEPRFAELLKRMNFPE